ncbi:hypothetical protein N7478_012414 [Penicillium angulare]|uniref:uncharacterized protein n=1 Tax=Penicillium angulare TaxID=116970 RepID=UPI0025407529|nr:uncharacterized protein N7478_012414 [Penicillium angulare]KAJ5259433.1 hypothetical protein N7478_012414 [Penicillium angulare]
MAPESAHSAVDAIQYVGAARLQGTFEELGIPQRHVFMILWTPISESLGLSGYDWKSKVIFIESDHDGPVGQI